MNNGKEEFLVVHKCGTLLIRVDIHGDFIFIGVISTVVGLTVRLKFQDKLFGYAALSNIAK